MSNSEMLYRELGSTGERVSAIGLGGWHLSLKHVDEQLAIQIVHRAIDRGITFMDNYGTAQHPDWLEEEPQRLQQLMSAAG